MPLQPAHVAEQRARLRDFDERCEGLERFEQLLGQLRLTGGVDLQRGQGGAVAQRLAQRHLALHAVRFGLGRGLHDVGSGGVGHDHRSAAQRRRRGLLMGQLAGQGEPRQA